MFPGLLAGSRAWCHYQGWSLGLSVHASLQGSSEKQNRSVFQFLQPQPKTPAPGPNFSLSLRPYTCSASLWALRRRSRFCILFRSRFDSCRSDSISDGVNGLSRFEVSCFALGESINSIAKLLLPVFIHRSAIDANLADLGECCWIAVGSLF